MLQRIFEEEIKASLGAEPYEGSEERRGWRNGYKPRRLERSFGKFKLLVPKDREGNFKTGLFERYQRSEKALVLSIVQMYLEGVSTRKVKAITDRLCGLEISRSQVSGLTKALKEEKEA